MKRLLTFPILLCTLALFAQPINDDCDGIIDLGVAPFCDASVIFNNVGATQSNIGMDNLPGCWTGDPLRDVWLKFTASDTILDYTITLTGVADLGLGLPPITNPQIAIYRGDTCAVDELVLLSCAPEMAAPGSDQVAITPPALTPGITYFIRINDWSPTALPNWGAFNLCVDKKDVVVTIDQGSSSECSGQLVDSGGLNGDYGNNENHVFTICPSQPHNCIEFTLDYYNIENFSDQIIIYDGDNTNAPIIGDLTGSGISLDTNGGVCFQTYASSGCLTVQFISDGTGTFEGFSGSWNCTSEPCPQPEVIVVDPDITDQAIIDNVSSPQTTVTIDTIICEDGAIGTFQADNTNLGLEKGLLITSGSAAGVANPGNTFTSISLNAPGDDELDYLSVTYSNGTLSNDACIIELDVFVTTDELTFEYIFGSEEYPEFVNQNFNDIFALLVSGPGIVGDPNIQNQKNISTLPDGTFIEINNVNSVQNWEYYRNNENGPSVAYDGLTSDYLGAKKSLTARTAVEPCNTYHLKIAVADRSDFIYDSGVFLSEIKSGTPQFSVNYFSGIDYFVEDCTTVPDEIVISIAEPKQDTTTYTLIVDGTATPDVDYIAGLPSTITFLPGQTELVFPVTIITDGITEGVETISLKLEKDFGCGSIDLSEITIELHDNIQVEILGNPNQDTIFICDGGLPLELSASGALQYFWSPPGLFDNPNIAAPIATPTTSQWVEVLGVLGACQDRDSVYLQIIDPEVSIEVLNGSNPMCEGNTLTLRANNNVNNANLQWMPTDGIKTDPNLPIVGLSPEPGMTNYVATVSLNGCSASDTIEVVVDPFDFPQLTTTDTTICQNFSVTLADSIPGGTTTVYEWLPNMWIDDNTIPNATVTPDVPTTYTLIATSASGVCADTASVSINVLPSEVEIMNPDTVELCLGESVWLETLTSTNGVGLIWSPATFLSNQSGDSILSTPTETIKYYANLVVGACEVVDSVVVVVDSLPDLTISTDPAKESFCKGEMVTLLSPTYEPANFPNIDFLWDIGPGIITPDTFLNLVFIAQDTFIYVRETRNRGCSSLDSIEIIVIPTNGIDIVPKDTAVCPGFPVQLLATAPGTVTDIKWSGQGLSCNECVDPVATIDSPGNYTISVEGEFEGCPVNNTATIEVWSPPSFSFPSNPNICFGESIDLNNPPDPNADYLWTLEDGTVVSTLPNPNVSPTISTTYLVSATSPEGCVSSASLNIGVFQDFNLSLNADQTICLGDEITLTAVPDANDNLTYVWTANGVQSNFDTPSITVSPTEATVYTVVAEDKAGCGFTDSISTTVNVNPIITTDSIQIFKGGELLSDTSNVYEGEIIDVVVFTTPPHDLLNNPTYEWFLDGAFLRVTSDNNSGEIIMPEVNGNQALSISVNVSDDNGCPFDPPSETILVLDDPVQIPNAFTPDGDEINNEFRLVVPDDLTPVIEEFKVFNRWGDMVYNNENGLLGWDGTYKGEPAPSDVYVYYIVYRLSEVAKKVTLKGEVTLLR